MNYEHLKVYWSGAMSWAWQNTKYIKWTSSFVLGLTIIYHLCDGAFGVNPLRSEVLWQWLGDLWLQSSMIALAFGLEFTIKLLFVAPAALYREQKGQVLLLKAELKKSAALVPESAMRTVGGALKGLSPSQLQVVQTLADRLDAGLSNAAMEAKDELLVMGLPFVELVPPHRHRYRIIKDFQEVVLRYLADHIGIQSGQGPTTPGATSTP